MSQSEEWLLIEALKDDTGLLFGFLAIHRGNKINPAVGVTRIARYWNQDTAIRDVLDLAMFASYRSAHAEIPYGGGAAIIFESGRMENPLEREQVLRSYLDQVNLLDGRFIVHPESGFLPTDISYMRERSTYITGALKDGARTGLPTLCRGLGLALERVYGNPDPRERTFAFLGLGESGSAFLDEIAAAVTEIWVADPHIEHIKSATLRYPELRINVMSTDDLLRVPADVLIPAEGTAMITPERARELGCKIIVGPADHQLASTEAGDILHERGILFVPDAVANAGLFTRIAHDFDQLHKKQTWGATFDQKIIALNDRLDALMNEAATSGRPTNEVADLAARARLDILFDYCS